MKKTLQQLGIHNYFYHHSGTDNTITDVSGVLVGHKTLNAGENIRTGVTVVVPPTDFSKHGFIAGGFVFNANGEMTGLQYILEEGKMISPIFLTNTLSVGDVFSAIVDYYQGKIALPIIGECWDGHLNDIEGRHVKKKHVIEAINNAKAGKIEQGCVGAGTGMTSFGFKSGIGSASRVVNLGNKKYTVGVLLNNNLGNEDGRHRYLRIGGVDVGKLLGEYTIRDKEYREGHQSSTIIIIATDAPLDHHQLNRLSKHAILGMGRVGIISYSGSGDFIISFSIANKVPKRETKIHWSIETIEETLLDDLFEATIEAVEESYLNSFLMAETTRGRDGHIIEALPIADIISKGKPK